MAALLLALLVALPLHGAWRVLGRKSPWPPRFLGLVAQIVGARARVAGTPLRHDVVFVSNHLSWIDILLLSGATGGAFVAKSELRGVPLVGWLCTLNHTIFVSRADRMAVTAQIAEIRGALAADWPVTLFPEGTTGDGTTLLLSRPRCWQRSIRRRPESGSSRSGSTMARRRTNSPGSATSPANTTPPAC
ncbi:lysophospholipid acyltransferase family protein [Sphingomonas aurantiaca]|uniref:lysophospholipid acyltransferase family protein n=1 Tax=Sphingomonas aurantiaca TaxID=185949 RepID=UPI002FDFDD72